MNHILRRAFQWQNRVTTESLLQKTKFCLQHDHHHLATKFKNVLNISKQTKWFSPFRIQSKQFSSRLIGKEFGYGVSSTKIENYKDTKHGAAFSNWKVLIGSYDWEGFKNGKSGVSRYRIQDLPEKSCPGLYELGVAVIGREIDQDNVISAYLGESKCVASRLREYRRRGGHLRYLNTNGENKAFFEDVLLNEGSILYRWAQLGTKREAEATEAKILCTYDYAWNTRNNGERRHLDLLKKLGDHEFMNHRKLSCDVDEAMDVLTFCTQTIRF